MLDTSKIKAQLEQRKADLEVRLSKVERDANHTNAPVSADSSEQAIERENDEVLEAIGEEAAHEITQITHALERIEEGSYGECEDCGGMISEQRLEVVPYTSQCIECAE